MYGECYQGNTGLALIDLKDAYWHVPISPNSNLPSCSSWVTNNTAFRPCSWPEHGSKDHHETGISDHFWPEEQRYSRASLSQRLVGSDGIGTTQQRPHAPGHCRDPVQGICPKLGKVVTHTSATVPLGGSRLGHKQGYPVNPSPNTGKSKIDSPQFPFQKANHTEETGGSIRTPPVLFDCGPLAKDPTIRCEPSS